MNTTRIFIAAFAAALSLVSCTKESADQKNSSSTSEPRVFTLEFSKQTRTTLGSDGITPEWTNGDKIWISNTESGEEVSVTVSGDKATITTTLKGTLKAVYPSSAVVKDGSGVISDFSVPATQHGTFAESNICMAENITEGDETITFVNKTAVLCFYVDESIGVSKIEIEGTGVATGQNKITVTPSSGTTLYEVGRGPDSRICYAAVLPVSGKQIKLTGTAKDSQVQPRTIPSATLAANTIYNAFIPYYIKIKVSDNPETYQKWGYCNVGAFLPEEYGEHFAWGETTGYQAIVSQKFFNNHTFNWGNCPFATCSDPKFNKYVPSDQSDYLADDFSGDTLTKLEFSDDAARQNWGSTWRMPTQEEFAGLAALDPECTGWDATNKGHRLTDANGNSIFLPAAGHGAGMELRDAGDKGYYWSSSLNTDDPRIAFFLHFDYNGDIYVDNNYIRFGRGLGYSVRPLSE